jgi:hypothetical protein
MRVETSQSGTVLDCQSNQQVSGCLQVTLKFSCRMFGKESLLLIQTQRGSVKNPSHASPGHDEISSSRDTLEVEPSIQLVEVCKT